MKRIPAVALLVMLVLAVAAATAGPVLQYCEVPERGSVERQDEYLLGYYNLCSGFGTWLWGWDGYCQASFLRYPPQYGTCFDLADSPGECRHLEDVWWVGRSFYHYDTVDVEIFCADENACPVGAPLAGIYDCSVVYHSPSWHRFDFGGLPLCGCDAGAGRFIVMISHNGEETESFSDANHKNIEAGCEYEWRCSGHSYVYRSYVSYCDVYGEPGPLWIAGPDYGCTNVPAVPPGCHDHDYSTGYYTEWLIDCYVSCNGPTRTEPTSWSEVKSLYR